MPRKVLLVERNAILAAPISSEAEPSTMAYPALRPGVLAALQKFSAAGYELVVLGSRSQPGEGHSPGIDFDTGNAFLASLLESQQIRVGSLRWCPHEPDSPCDCRPPAVGLVRDVLGDPGLDRRGSLVVGPVRLAAELASNIGLRGVGIASSGDESAPSGDARSWAEIAHAELDQPRTARIERRTRETDIAVSVDLDRTEDPRVSTGIGFFDHMLEQLGKHSGIALEIRCRGDLEVDEHHTVEDVAIAVGAALAEALGDKRGIHRYGFLLPMDESEAQVALDLSGRAYFLFDGSFDRESVGGLPTELVPHFFRSLSESLGATLHLSVRGENAHHMIEACFKGVARTLRMALRRDGDEIPSTKGQL